MPCSEHRAAADKHPNPPHSEPVPGNLSFRRSAAPNRPCNFTLRATEKSTLRLLVAPSRAPHQPCPVLVPPYVWSGLPRLPSCDPTVDSSALQPPSQEADGSVAGPRNDSRLHPAKPRGAGERHCENPGI